MGASFIVYGQDSDPNDAGTPRLVTRDITEALAEFLKIVQNEEAGTLVWSS